MGLSKSQRMWILLGVDVAFFLLELIIGYSVHSLALVADSFHMLNDVISLCISIWAVRAVNKRSDSKMFTYGLQRSEVLGALINGVFLVALCVSIFLDAIQRFFEPQTVSQPKLILIVGCCGLASNILGLFLFHDHGHDHGPDASHEHDHGNGLEAAEAGLAQTDPVIHEPSPTAGDTSADSPPTPRHHENSNSDHSHGSSRTLRRSTEDVSSPLDSDAFASPRKSASSGSGSRLRRHHGVQRQRHSSIDEIPTHPASFRSEIIAKARLDNIDSSPSDESDGEADMGRDPAQSERSRLLSPHARDYGSAADFETARAGRPPKSPASHSQHNHRQHKAGHAGGHGHGHSHGDLNMRGVFLHVLGDALGNMGVIASALFIWLTTFWWRYYADPLISLIITAIILWSALPLCRASARILLQAVPDHLSVDDITADIEDLPGVVSCHHLHVWQLSGTKLVASLHVQLALDMSGPAAKKAYMMLAQSIRTCLHEYGIHSSTIQPEFCLDTQHLHLEGSGSAAGGTGAGANSHSGHGHPGTTSNSDRGSKRASGTNSPRGSLPDACLLECDDRCHVSKCCPPPLDRG